MSSERFKQLVNVKGINVTYHKDDGTEVCPCLTPEGFRDPKWHIDNPDAEVCNEQGYLSNAVEFSVKAMVQPIRGGRRNNRIRELFADIEVDDQLGFFPYDWDGRRLDFDSWSQAGEDWIEVDGTRYMVVGFHLIPDPANGERDHHWELNLRLMSKNG